MQSIYNYHKSLKKLKNSLNSVKTDFLKIAEHYGKLLSHKMN